MSIIFLILLILLILFFNIILFIKYKRKVKPNLFNNNEREENLYNLLNICNKSKDDVGEKINSLNNLIQSNEKILKEKKENYESVSKKYKEKYFLENRKNKENGEMLDLMINQNPNINNPNIYCVASEKFNVNCTIEDYKKYFNVFGEILKNVNDNLKSLYPTPFLTIYDQSFENDFKICLPEEIKSFNYFSFWFKMFKIGTNCVIFGNYDGGYGFNVEKTADGNFRIKRYSVEEYIEKDLIFATPNTFELNTWVNLSVFFNKEFTYLYKNGMRVANSYEFNYNIVNNERTKTDYCIGRDNRNNYQDVLFTGILTKLKFFDSLNISELFKKKNYEEEKKDIISYLDIPNTTVSLFPDEIFYPYKENVTFIPGIFSCISIWCKFKILNEFEIIMSFGNNIKGGLDIFGNYNSLKINWWYIKNQFIEIFKIPNIIELDIWTNFSILFTFNEAILFKNGIIVERTNNFNYNIINQEENMDISYSVGYRLGMENQSFSGEIRRIKFFDNPDMDNLIIEKNYEEDKIFFINQLSVQNLPTPYLYIYNKEIINNFNTCLDFSLENFNCFSIWFNTSDLSSRGILFGNYPKEGFNVEKTLDNNILRFIFKPPNNGNIFEIFFQTPNLFELNNWVNLTVLLTKDNIKIFKNGNEITSSNELNYDLFNKLRGKNNYCFGRDNRDNYQDTMFRGEMCKLKFFNNSDIDNLIIEKIYEEEKKDILEMTITPFLVLYDKEIINNFNKCLGFSLENFNYFSIWFKMYYFKKQIFVLIGNWPENGLNIEITENGEIRIYLNKGEEREIYEVPGILNNSNFYNWTNLSIFLTLNDIEIYKNGMRVANSYELNYLKINTYLEKNNYCVGRDNRKDYREVLFNGEISKIKFYNNRTINQWVITQIYEKEKKELKLLV